MTTMIISHRACGLQESRLRLQLLKANNELAKKNAEFNELAKCHDELVQSFIDEAGVQRQLTNEKAELASKVERLEGMEKVLAEKIAPQLGAAFMLLNKLNGHIEKWSEGSKGGVPYMPIEPGMAEAVKSLVEDLSNHIVVVDRESIAKAMAEILGHA